MADNFSEYISYIGDILQTLLDLIMNHWITAVLFGIQVLYLIINAIKLKRNTE